MFLTKTIKGILLPDDGKRKKPSFSSPFPMPDYITAVLNTSRPPFSITYGYNAYFWDNGIANNLFFSVAIWWLFGAWVICLIVLFSSLLQNNTGVALCIGGTVLLAYLLSVIPKVKAYSPIALMNTNSLLIGEAEIDAYIKAIVVAVSLCIVCVAVSIPVINKRQL